MNTPAAAPGCVGRGRADHGAPGRVALLDEPRTLR